MTSTGSLAAAEVVPSMRESLERNSWWRDSDDCDSDLSFFWLRRRRQDRNGQPPGVPKADG